MANIIAFRAVRPNPVHADRLVFSAKSQPDTACTSCGTGSVSNLKLLLESEARIRPEISKIQEQAYQKINQTFKQLLENGDLLREHDPGFYVYEIVHPKYRQTGIWH